MFFIQVIDKIINFANNNYLRKKVMGDINRIKVVLAEKKKTSKWLAEQLGKDTSTISKWCTNVYQPSLENIDKIAQLLGVNRKDLLNDSK